MKYLRPSVALLTVLVVPMLHLSPRLAADEVDAPALYKKVLKSCVFIVTPLKGGYAMGSGSLIDAERKYVLTNYHVVSDRDMVYCQFPVVLKSGEVLADKNKYMDRIPAGQAIKGKVLFRDISRDLALIKLEKVPYGTPAIPLAKKSADPATRTWNIGSPGAVNQVFGVTEGQVRQVGLEKMTVGDEEGVFQVRAKMVKATNPTNPGDSGGPLYDKRGYLVAVTESGDTHSQAVNFFVDVSEVCAMLAEHKITIKELSNEPDAKTTPRATPKLVTPSVKNGGPKETPGVKTPPANVGGDAPSAADEKTAANLLRRAKFFASGEENRADYIRKLTEIVKKYPKTAAGKEAKRRLDMVK